MSKFLFLIDAYFPYANANTLCVKTIVDKLIAQGDKIDIFAIRDDLNQMNINNGLLKVFFFHNSFTKQALKLSEHNRTLQDLNIVIRKCLALKNKIVPAFYEKFVSPKVDTVDMNAMFETFKANNSIENYDYVVSVSYPFTYAKLADKIVRYDSDIKMIQYMLDPYVYNYTLSRKGIDRRKKQFLKYTENCNKIIFTRGIEEENKRRGFVHGLENKSLVVDLPNLVKKENIFLKYNYADKIQCFYAGRFYEDIRNPEKMLEVMSKLEIDNMIFSVYGVGCDDILSEYKKSMDNGLEINGYVPYEECAKISLGANILVNLGNSIPNQVPSKVFEYISSGKPVINFYTDEHDTSLYYFRKYGMAYNFNLNNYDNNDLKNLKDFININYNKHLNFNEATILLKDSLGENVTDIICDFIKLTRSNDV